MIKVSELWIGDLLRLKRSGRIGKFAGVSPNQKIKVKVDNKVILTTVKNLEYAPNNISDNNTSYIERPSFNKSSPVSINNILDLHIEVLNPSMVNTRAERIVNYQIEAAENFIKEAIARRLPKIEIIHGKGAGILKMEVEHLLHLHSEHIKAQFPINQGGSVEIWFVTPR